MKKIKFVLVFIGLVGLALWGFAFSQFYDYVRSDKTEKELRKEVTPQIIEMKEMAIISDPEQEKTINNLKVTLESIIQENKRLVEQEKHLSTETVRLKEEMTSKDNQINFLTSLNSRLETSSDSTRKEYEEEIERLKREKERLGKDLKKERERMEKARIRSAKQLEELNKEVNETRKKMAKISSKAHRNKLLRETAHMHYNLGNIFVEMSQYKKAVREYRRALHLLPDDADTHYNLAVVYDVHFRDLSSALEHYKRCLELKPRYKNNKEIKERIIYLELKETVSIRPTLAADKDRHPLSLDRVDTTGVFEK